jgi:predicted DNA-binding transcriptional regulator AlpA
MSQTDHITTSEVARMLQMPLATVKRYAATGKLPTVCKLAGTTGAYVYDRAAIIEWDATRRGVAA